VDAIADDPAVAPGLRARGRYLDGNLAFLDGAYESAVKAYDRVLVLSPGEADAADSVGRDAAWNRAIALRRIDDRKDAGADAWSLHRARHASRRRTRRRRRRARCRLQQRSGRRPAAPIRAAGRRPA
jgi:hypothetical protein